MQKKQKRSTWVILLCAAALLALGDPSGKHHEATHMLFTVLKKGAVYAVVASSMNLLNGFTGLSPWARRASCCWAPTPTRF